MMAGYGYGAGYMLAISLTSIWLSNLGARWSVFELVFYVMVAAAICFLLADIRNFRRNHAAIRDNFGGWAITSIAVVGMWLCTYYSTMKGSASFFLALYFLSAAAWVKIANRNWILAGICILAGAFCYVAVPAATPLILATSVAGGLFGVLYSHHSKKLSEAQQLTVLGILSIRFYVIIVIAGLLAFLIPHPGIPETHKHGWAIVFVIALLNVVLPNALSQATLHRLGVERMYVLLTLLPVLVITLEGLISDRWHALTLISMASASLALNAGPLLRLVRPKREDAAA